MRAPLIRGLVVGIAVAALAACERGPRSGLENKDLLLDSTGIATGGTAVNDTVPYAPNKPTATQGRP